DVFADRSNEMASSSIDTGTFAGTIRQDIHETARQLNAALGPTLVSLLAGSKNRRAASRWADPQGAQPRSEAHKRLLAAHEVWVQIAGNENEHVARNWFIGANPRLNDRSPIECLREGKLAEVKS